MSPLGTRRGIEEFARLLDGARSPVAAGPEGGFALAGQFALVSRLRAAGPALDTAAAPRPEFRAALRTRLLAVASVTAAQAADPAVGPRPLASAVSWSQSRRTQRRVGVTAGAMASVIALTGIGIASSRSLPGEPFYGLKRGVEDVQLGLVGGDVAKGAKHLQFAETRLREVSALAHGRQALSGALVGSSGLLAAGPEGLGGSLTSRVRSTLRDMDAETRTGHRLLEAAYRRTGRTEPLRLLSRFSDAQRGGLVALLPSLPDGARQRAENSLALVTVIGDDARSLLDLGTCTGACNPANAGPVLSGEPPAALVPSAGPSAVPSASPSADTNGVPDCTCLAPATRGPGVGPDVGTTGSNGPGAGGVDQPSGAPAPAAPASPTPEASTAASPIAPLPTALPEPTASASLLPVPLPPLPLPTITLPPELVPSPLAPLSLP